jgi:hypothetical protein
MKLATITVFGLSMLTVLGLSGCVGAPEEEGAEPVGAAEQAVTNVTLNAVAFGNWAQNGVRTSNNQLTGTVGGVEHAGYWVFDLTSVAGRTCTYAELVLDNAASGFRENITSPKPGLRTPFRPIGSTTIHHLITGNNDPNVYQQIRKDREDYSYFYQTKATGVTNYGLFGYETDRIPALIKGAKAGTMFAVAAWPSNVNEDTEVDANGTGDQYIFNGVTALPKLHLVLQ